MIALKMGTEENPRPSRPPKKKLFPFSRNLSFMQRPHKKMKGKKINQGTKSLPNISSKEEDNF